MGLRRAALILLFGLLPVAGCSGCTKTNPALCCTSAPDCAKAGLSQPKLCGNGLACDHNTCVQADCQSDADCPSAHPACVLGLCADCSASRACAVNAPVCIMDTSTCGPCTRPADCAAFVSTPVCDTASGACVQCMTSDQCSGATPICDADACRGCRTDSECASGACAPNGSCVPESAIVWISVNGTDSGSCTQAMPCSTLAYAIGQASNTREHIVLGAGFYPTGITLDPLITTVPELFIHGNGATLTALSGNSPPDIINAKLPLTIDNLKFFGDAIPLDVAAPVSLHQVSMQGTKHVNVSSSLTATDLSITGTTDTSAAISLANTGGGSLTIDRGTIAMASSAISAGLGAQVHLQNLLIWGTSVRAIAVVSAADIASSTIVDSGANTGGSPCTVLGQGALTITSTIIWQHGCGGDPTRDAVAGGAGTTFTNSIVSNTTPTPGTTDVDPRFVNEAAHDYHIQSTSPAKDAVDTGPQDDYEGDVRPQGPKYDIGADEAPP